MRYRVPPSALVMSLAASRMRSSKRVISRSLESEAPISLSCSRRLNKSSTESILTPLRLRFEQDLQHGLQSARHAGLETTGQDAGGILAPGLRRCRLVAPGQQLQLQRAPGVKMFGRRWYLS